MAKLTGALMAFHWQETVCHKPKCSKLKGRIGYGLSLAIKVYEIEKLL